MRYSAHATTEQALSPSHARGAPALRPNSATQARGSNQAHLRRLMASRLQAKLTIGAVDDPLEHEADAAADRVMRMAEPQISDSSAAPKLSRKCEKCDDDKVSAAQAKRGDLALEAGGDAPEGIEVALDAPGRPLDENMRGFFEPRFGHDFGQVRVHTDSNAAEANRQLGAQAFTFGAHVFFAEGKGPGHDFLTGHELAHVVQQGAAPSIDAAGPARPAPANTAQRWIQRLPGDGMSPPGDCSWSTYIPLRISKETAVAIAEGLGGCKGDDSCPRLAFKIAAIGAEIAARVAVAAECFRGGDTGHVEQIRNKTTALDTCLALFAASNCSPDLIEKMKEVVEGLRALLATTFVVTAAAVVIALIVVIIIALIALIEAIVAAIAAAAAAAAEAAAILAAAAALVAMLGALKDQLAEA
jgi:hypothetical protein